MPKTVIPELADFEFPEWMPYRLWELPMTQKEFDVIWKQAREDTKHLRKEIRPRRNFHELVGVLF